MDGMFRFFIASICEYAKIIVSCSLYRRWNEKIPIFS